jgi:hypothetical protein
MKPKWTLLIALVLCAAPYGCATTEDAPTTAQQPRQEPVLRTGSRIPTRETGGASAVSPEDWANDRRDGCSNCRRGN